MKTKISTFNKMFNRLDTIIFIIDGIRTDIPGDYEDEDLDNFLLIAEQVIENAQNKIRKQIHIMKINEQPKGEKKIMVKNMRIKIRE